MRLSLVVGSLVAAACGAEKGTGSDPFGNTGSGKGGGAANGGLGNTGGKYFSDTIKPGGAGTSGSVGDPGSEGVCGLKKFNLQQVEPDIMLVLDRSGSMMHDASGGTATPTKWSDTTGALQQVLSQTENTIYWGMQMYPTCTASGQGLQCNPTPCTVAGLSQAPALGQAAALNGQITQNTPRIDTGATPTKAAVEAAVATLQAGNSGRRGFLLLATDGMPNCRNFPGGNTGGGDTDADGAVAAVAASVAAGIEVFVVGIATADNPTSHQTLERMAEAGGRPQMGATKHYPVANRAQLVTALTDIAGQVRDCTFNLGTAPPSPSDVAVDIDGTRLARGADWEYGPGNTTVVVKGSWCSKLKAGTAKDAQITFGCPGMPIP